MRDEIEEFVKSLGLVVVGFVIILSVLYALNFFYTTVIYIEQKKVLSQNEQVLTKNSESYIQGRNSGLNRLYLELQKHEVGSNAYNAVKETGCDINLQLNIKNQKWSSICE